MKTVKDERWLWAFFMTLVVFFGRFAMQGISSDAAMYAGLSRSILENGHWWAPQGKYMFPVFFEHPPYFFQWGALVLSVLGQSDGAARAIGAIPGMVGLLVLVTWVWRRHSWGLAFWTLVFLLTFGHYTKYAASSMLEAPLSLGAILFAIGTFEFFFRTDYRKDWLAVACLGAAISTASKGVVGFLFCAALTPYVLFFVKQDSHWFKRKGSWFLMCGIAAAFPLLLWAFMTWNFDEGSSLLARYLKEQVFRSYSTDRGRPELYAQSWSWWTYPYVILKYGWPWWWTVPVGAIWIKNRPNFTDVFLKAWVKLAVTFFAVLLVAFSTSHVRLPHYLHPTYLLLAPLGAFAMLTAATRFVQMSDLTAQRLRWVALGVVAFASVLVFRGNSSTANRGQEFVTLGQSINQLPPKCEVYVPDTEMEMYRMESYSMWYLKGRGYQIVTPREFEKSYENFDSPRIWWTPSTGEILIHPACETHRVS